MSVIYYSTGLSAPDPCGVQLANNQWNMNVCHFVKSLEFQKKKNPNSLLHFKVYFIIFFPIFEYAIIVGPVQRYDSITATASFPLSLFFEA